ncbi:DUF2238 domain-containing protein [Leeia sp. TBRC 13508]|uniref:DUF2238 domain-containing protein n=1 Tax=Leeia speluncae TaxID=2884804 RepID=A0ABS8D8F1_9NEIS|nr:DUF2238 domain-containing protein [Leeia speluncae]MCB6184499.1 DUF2238 domain-containing protein [Leeia speluncae]
MTLKSPLNPNQSLIILSIGWSLGLILSYMIAVDKLTWILEVFPCLLALPILWFYQHKIRFTSFLYGVILLHGWILMMGGAYTYAKVPLGFEIQSWFSLSRNPYDKIGHFYQGFGPALICREVFICQSIVTGRKMANFLCISVVMLISSSYELIEWVAALILNQGADQFLGTQGDPWDTQSDMAFALFGGLVALFLFSRLQDKALLKRA